VFGHHADDLAINGRALSLVLQRIGPDRRVRSPMAGAPAGAHKDLGPER